MKIIFLSFFLTGFLTTTCFAAPHLVSETVGSAQDQVLTSREMVLSFVVENALNKKSRNLPTTRDEKIQAVNSYLLDVMVGFEAAALGYKDYSKADVENLTGQTDKALTDNSLKFYKIQKSEIHDMVEQKLVVKSFLKYKSNSFDSILTDQDLQTYFEKNRLRFGTVPFADVKENIRVFLMQQQRDDRLKAWIEVLKKKYKARNYLIEHQGRDAKTQ